MRPGEWHSSRAKPSGARNFDHSSRWPWLQKNDWGIAYLEYLEVGVRSWAGSLPPVSWTPNSGLPCSLFRVSTAPRAERRRGHGCSDGDAEKFWPLPFVADLLPVAVV